MSDEQDVVDVVPEQTAQEALAAMREGFAEASNVTPAQDKTAKVAEPTPEAQQAEQKSKAEAEAAEKAATEAKSVAEAKEAAQKEQAAKLVAAGYTAEEIGDAIKKAKELDRVQGDLNKIFGKFGGIEQQLKTLAEKKVAGVQVTAEDLTDLQEAYGPEMSEAMMKVLTKIVAKINPADLEKPAEAPKVDEALAAAKAEYDAKLAKATADTKDQLTRDFERKLLDITHKDWREVTIITDSKGNFIDFRPEFKVWLDTLPEADQKEIKGGWNSAYVAGKITEYKDYMKQKTAAAPTTSNRLKAGVQPKGTTGTATVKSDLDWQREGYTSV